MTVLKCKDYNIYINEWLSLLTIIADGSYSSIFVIVDENTQKLCLPILQTALDIEIKTIDTTSGEQNKTLSACESIWQSMVNQGADRHSLCLNLGGGVVGDMGGFSASTYMRGMDFIQIPTTLLSQVDASVGGKLGVDFHYYKNMIGLIRNPKAVFIFTQFLETLPAVQLRSGYAELIKHGLIADKPTYTYLCDLNPTHHHDWEDIILQSVTIKQSITEQDPLEKGMRKILNFGHTLGHAIESNNLSRAEPLLHGEAIAIGMVMESYLSYKLDYISLAECDDIKSSIVNIYGHHPERIPPIDVLTQLMLKDKKNKGGITRYSLLEAVGKGNYDQEVPREYIEGVIAYYKK